MFEVFVLFRGPTTLMIDRDPALDGCRETPVRATLELLGDAAVWPDGAPRPERPIGVDPSDRTRYREFASEGEMKAAGYGRPPGSLLRVSSWREVPNSLRTT
jgi:hypothetical protein